MTETLRLSWATSAARWEEATPLGNGRIGAMAFGGASGRFQINDATVWSGTPDGPALSLAQVVAAGAGPQRLADVRAALDAGDVRTAERLLMAFQGPYSQEFLPLADLLVAVSGTGDGDQARVLDLDEAVLTESLRTPSGVVRRRSWVSAPAQGLVVELTADSAFDVTIELTTPLRRLDGKPEDATRHGLTLDVLLPIDGAPLHEEQVDEPLRYADQDAAYDAFAAVAASLRTDGIAERTASGLTVHGARRVLIALSTATRAESWWAEPEGDWRTVPREAIRGLARTRADAAARCEATDLLADHIADRRSLTRTRFAIGGRREGTWDVHRDVLHGDDPQLRATVIAEFGRYLLVSCSRAGGPAANLQGIWNDQLRPAWSSNYTININTQMNYWAAPLLGAVDAFEPLIALVEHLARTGADTARTLYGARGWVAHHNSDLWGWSLPVGGGHGAPSWAIWMMGGVWLTHNLWDAYEFTGDLDLLRARIWPLLRGAAEFCLDWLVEDAEGMLRTSPSTSPENSFFAADGAPTALGLTSASDLLLIRALFERALHAVEALDIDDPITAELDHALARLTPVRIGDDGRLREWSAEVEEVEPLHRHMTPLVALYPLDLVTRERTPELFDASVRLLDARGTGAMGWSWAWKVALRARIGDGDAAAGLLAEALAPFEGDAARHGPVDGSEWGGLLPNLFSTHPPFQIDGNLGFPAAIAEMLVQSHDGVVRLLPALPSDWERGEVQGVRARTALAVDLAWSGGRLSSAHLQNLSDTERTVTVEHGGNRIAVELAAGASTELLLADFRTPAAAQGGALHAR
ncbi:glycosyl hydrolase family 95 catalytic domain-containing protein [Microbacterium sp. ZW T6_19]|uniref:glycosyl hydrolase family 95 catalytic domain-containing protein n=1 Tax=Microbacterium sp. ZW T6_19 TaxID=3378082 RepID=UPI003854902E